MNIFPAIDILGGKAVRLTEGDYNKVKEYSSSPAAVAVSFREAGAKYIHIVDLDGAREGRRINGDAIREAATASSLLAEVGGGIRTLDDVEYYLSRGAERVIIGTAAVKNPDFLRESVRRFGNRIAVGADLKDGLVAVNGWLEKSALTGEEFLRRLAGEGVAAVIITDVGRDGLLRGANVEMYRRLRPAAGGMEMIASGGVARREEIAALARAGADGAILGKALYEGRLDLRDCLAAAREAENAG